MKRTPLVRRTPLASRAVPLRRTPIRRVSPKRQREQRTYTLLRRAFLDARPRCEWPGGCAQPASEVHHKRGRVGDDYLDTTRWLPLCTPHHAWITAHPLQAYDMGVSERRIGAA